MSKPEILAISGSLRAASFNTSVLKTLAAQSGDKANITVRTLNDIPMFSQDLESEPPASVADLRAAMKAADGIIISTPEYNHGPSGALINALDWTSRPYGQSSYMGKQVLIMSASPASTGGARAHAQLYQNFVANACHVIGGPQVCVAGAHEKIENGQLTDTATLDFLQQALDRLLATL
ncbi:MAG: NADPH-dependent FMN reductase [Hirschia sp.]|nr:NADPH-dependent FMN reductase [Hirschia sp.]MBF18767.1 NADPH-dependent FMN reductase [Hirschia sp.]